jgi:zinc transport system ATP-binding protein
MEGVLSFKGEFEKTYTGYLSQQIAPKQDFPAGAFEIVMSGNLGKMKLRPFYTRTERQKALENMRLLGIADLKTHCFRELSGGQQRRVLLARSLCAAKNLLILDEPFAGLDPLISAELYQQLTMINRETGMTIVMASHDVDAADCVTHVLHLQKRQLFFGSAEEYKRSETGKNFFGKMEKNDV